MTDLNAVILIGRTTRDLELTYTQGGLAIGKFSVATNKSYKGKDGEKKEEVSYFEVTCFGKMAETMSQYVKKGKQIAVHGELKQDRWTQDGQTRSKVFVIADSLQLLGNKDGHANQSDAQRGYEQPQNNFTEQQKFDDDGFPEEVPF